MHDVPPRTNEDYDADWDGLAEQFREGSPTATEELFRRLYPFVQSWVKQRLRTTYSQRVDPDDIVQKVLLRLFEHGLSFDPSRGQFLGYIMSLTRNTIVDEVKRLASRRTIPFTDAALFPEVLFTEETNDATPDLPEPSELVEQKNRRRRKRPRRHGKRQVAVLSLDAMEVAHLVRDDKPDAEQEAMAAEARTTVQDAVRDALAGLPKQIGRAVTLRLLGGKSSEEIAKELGTTRSTAARLVYHGLEELRSALSSIGERLDLDSFGLELVFETPVQMVPAAPDRLDRPFVEAVDPYVVGRPVTHDLFVGRNDILKQVRRNLEPSGGHNILVLRGQRRTGKTSVLFRLRDTLARESRGQFLPVFVDVQGMTSCQNEGEFLYELADHIHTSLRVHGVVTTLPSRKDFLDTPSLTFKLDFLRSVTEALARRRILLMLDEFEKMRQLLDDRRLGEQTLDLLRHLMQHSPLLFLIAGTQQLRELTGGTWSVFFNLAVPIDIGILAEHEARWLIQEPVRAWYTVDDAAADDVVRSAGAHPYFTQLVCKKVLEVRNESRVNVITSEHVRRACRLALVSGDDQIGYPWTEEDCTPAERMVLSLMAQEAAGQSTVAADDVQSRLEDFWEQFTLLAGANRGMAERLAAGLDVSFDQSVDRLRHRAVLRLDQDQRLAFTVPLFHEWLINRTYDSPEAAVQYNLQLRPSLGGHT